VLDHRAFIGSRIDLDALTVFPLKVQHGPGDPPHDGCIAAVHVGFPDACAQNDLLAYYLRLRDARSTWSDVERLLERAAGAPDQTRGVPRGFEVVVDGVGFAYDRGPMLSDITCRFAECGVTALLGRSGTAHCDAFITSLPAGYDTPLRAGAPKMSLGERQRIALARALVGNAPVVIFDECTASLDPEAERAVHAAIETLAQRATVVLITHRLGTVRNAKRIIVLANGRIAESGTHETLIRKRRRITAGCGPRTKARTPDR
jgi:ABC-type multidrug transport system fused ATPase/permease subunit